MSDWQPIETAPLDGTPVLLFCPGQNCWNRYPGMPDIVVGLWVNHVGFGRGGWLSDIGDVCSGYESSGAYFEHQPVTPTHWMPLPDPPQSPAIPSSDCDPGTGKIRLSGGVWPPTNFKLGDGE